MPSDGSLRRIQTDVATGPLHQGLLADIQREFPRFDIRRKRGSPLQLAIAVALGIVTLGGQRSYLSTYHTVLFGTLWVSDAWDGMDDVERYVLLRHERVHLKQRQRMGDLVMAFVYLLPFFPVGLAWGRARIEWEAYVETIRATAETRGIAAAKALEDEIVRRYVSADYAWMWPFPTTIRRWFHDVLADIEAEAASPD
ncbi:MAG: hypothetical protein FWD17_20100 [Polyangiaceae bacterium]|nr:hypothetical protein [Polyangiaceae bacterium]